MKICDLESLLNIHSVHRALRRQALWVLGATNLLTALALVLSPRPVILIPPTLDQAVEVDRNEASAALKESWGLYVAELLGNITPANASFIEKTLGPLLSAGVYPEVMSSVSQDLQALKADRVSIRFRSLEVVYDAVRDRVFVRGETTTQGPGSPALTQERTYQIDLRFHHYRPRIEAIEVYPGGPRGLDPTLHTPRSPHP